MTKKQMAVTSPQMKGEMEMRKTEYLYGMRLRGFSIGCQPMEGLKERIDDETGRYHDVLVYDRELTEEECINYELDFIERRQ